MKTSVERYKQDFNQALDIYENDYSHNDLIEFLKNGSVAEKQAAVLKLDNLYSKEDANVLINNLTGCDGKIREAVSFKLPEFVKNYPEWFTDYVDIFIEAIIDINGNICRNTLKAIKYLKPYKAFCEVFCKRLISKTYELSIIAKNFDIQEGKYKINKEVFKLYWYLEAIYLFLDCVENNPKLVDILDNSKDVIDYTIREKAAKIISEMTSQKALKIKALLDTDENYYVRRFK